MAQLSADAGHEPVVLTQRTQGLTGRMDAAEGRSRQPWQSMRGPRAVREAGLPSSGRGPLLGLAPGGQGLASCPQDAPGLCAVGAVELRLEEPATAEPPAGRQPRGQQPQAPLSWNLGTGWEREDGRAGRWGVANKGLKGGQGQAPWWEGLTPVRRRETRGTGRGMTSEPSNGP